MTDAPPLLQLPPLPQAIRLLTSSESQILNERLPMASVTVENCITCHGAKTFLWKDTDGSSALYECPCEDQYVLHRFLLNSGVLLNYQRLGWNDFVHLSAEAATAASDYLDHRDRYVNAGIGMVFTGSRGNGKSLLAHLMLKMLISEGVNCFATTFGDMIDAFAAGWRERSGSRWFSRAVRNAGVLLIDDLGRERHKGPASVGDDMLETVVRHRVSCQQPTIITTNLSEKEILSGYGGHTMSLLTERSMIVEVTGADRRGEMKERLLTEVKQGLTRPVVLA